jgi:hypothetical protein
LAVVRRALGHWQNGPMASKQHPTPLSGGDRKALAKELGRARAMTKILASQSDDARAKGEALIRQADKLLCESWNEKMWADGGPIDPSPTVDQAVERRLPVARDRMLALQDETGRRLGCSAPRSDHGRPRSGEPPSLQQVC